MVKGYLVRVDPRIYNDKAYLAGVEFRKNVGGGYYPHAEITFDRNLAILFSFKRDALNAAKLTGRDSCIVKLKSRSKNKRRITS